MLNLSTFLLLLCCQLSNGQSFDYVMECNCKTDEKSDDLMIEKFPYEGGFSFWFMFFRVPWDEAKVMCASKNGRLAVLDNRRKYEFVGSSMVETDIQTYEDIWIGGLYSEKRGEWTWVDNSRSRLETRFPAEEVFPRAQYPPWLEDPAGVNATLRCLAAHRYDHKKAVFVTLPCQLSRPFLCEMYNDKREDVVLENKVEESDVVYHVVNWFLPWRDAYLACRERNWDLAVLDSEKPLKKLANIMRRRRPVIESAWIGGRYDTDKDAWMWTSDKAINNDRNGSVFPPWLNQELKKAGCLLLDRHICRDPVFLEESCVRPRPFICEERPFTGSLNITVEIWPYPGSKILVGLRKKTWFGAWSSCLENNATLLTFTQNNTKEFSKLIANLKRSMITAEIFESAGPIDHIWLGGRLSEGKWRWVTSWPEETEELPTLGFTRETAFKYGEGSNDWVRFCLGLGMEEREDMACLNLSRENHDKLILYGLMCNHLQHYFCVTE